MHVWINLDTVKYYERHDQMQKMIHLLQGIHYLLDHKHFFNDDLVHQLDIYIADFVNDPKRLVLRIPNAADMPFAYESPYNQQSICFTDYTLSAKSEIKLYHKEEVFFNEEYNYFKDLKFVINSWIDQLYAHNYFEEGPKKYHIPHLNKDNKMIFYFPAAALHIYANSPSKGSNKYESAFRHFKSSCEEAVINNPINYTVYMTALQIYTSQKEMYTEPTSPEFRANLHLWK